MSGNGTEQTYPAVLNDAVQVLGNYHYNLYLVRGSAGTALVEVGVSAIVDAVIGQLEQLGVSPDYLVVTHPHADHLTGLEGLCARFPEATVLTAPGAREFAEHPKAAALLREEDAYIHQVMERFGYPPGRAPVDAPPSLAGCRLARSGDVLDLGSVRLRFLEVKGHSPGNLVVHLPEADTLLLSDSLGFHYPGRRFMPMFFTNYPDYMHTLERLQRLQPRYLGLGHQGPIAGAAVAEAFAATTRAAEDLLQVVRERGQAADSLAEELFHDLYQDELVINSEQNIRNCMKLLVRRCAEVL